MVRFFWGLTGVVEVIDVYRSNLFYRCRRHVYFVSYCSGIQETRTVDERGISLLMTDQRLNDVRVNDEKLD